MDDLSGMHLRVEVLGNPNNESHFAVFSGAERDHTRAHFLAQRVDHLAQCFAVKSVDFGGNQANPLHILRLFGQIGGRRAGSSASRGLELLLKLLHFVELPLECRDHFIFAGVSIPATERSALMAF